MIDLSKVVTLGPPKEAALYFDKVLPIDLGEVVVVRTEAPEVRELYIPLDGVEIDDSVVSSLLRSDGNAEVYTTLTHLGVIARMCGFFEQDEEFRNSPHDPAIHAFFRHRGFELDDILKQINSGTFNKQLIIDRVAHESAITREKLGFGNSTLWTTSSFVNHATKSKEENTENYVATLNNFRALDITKISWKQVIEFRNDKTSMAALRDFRMMFSEDFSNASYAEIQDRIAKKLDKFEMTTKTWGIALAEKTFSAVFSKESAASSIVGAALIPAAGLTIGALIAGISIAGKATLTIVSELQKKKVDDLDSPVRYISKLNSLSC